MTKERLNQLAENLLFMSETDAPLEYFELSPDKSKQWPPSTGGHFLSLIGEGAAKHVEKLAPEKFFRDLRQGNEDSEDQVAALGHSDLISITRYHLINALITYKGHF